MFRGKGKAGGGSSKSRSGSQKVTVTKTRKMETPQEYIMKLRAALFNKDGTVRLMFQVWDLSILSHFVLSNLFPQCYMRSLMNSPTHIK